MTETLSRRRFLAAAAAGGAAAIAGCGAVSDASDSEKSRELLLTLSREDGALRDSRVVDLAEDDPEWDRAAFEAARDGETYTTRHRRPFFSTEDDPVYAQAGGTYYRLGSVVVDEVATTHPVLWLSVVEDPAESPSVDRVDADELSESDWRAVRVAHLAARARGNEGGAPWGLVQRGGYVFRSDETVQKSALLGEDAPAQVTFRDTVHSVEASRERFHEPVYRATAEPVAESPERMESVLRAVFVDARFSRDDLSSDARDVLREARTGEYAESHPYSSAYEDILIALHERAYLDGDVERDSGVERDGRRMCLYDDAYYDYVLRFRSTD